MTTTAMTHSTSFNNIKRQQSICDAVGELYSKYLVLAIWFMNGTLVTRIRVFVLWHSTTGVRAQLIATSIASRSLLI
jgi:hypothetical protein